MLRARLANPRAAISAAAATVVLAVGVVLAVNWTSSGSASAAGNPATLHACGAVPVSNGAHARSVRATLTAPTTARSGTRIAAQIVLSSTTGASVQLQTGQPSDLLIIYSGKIVGRYSGSTLGTGAYVTVGPQTKSFPAGVLLSGCASKVDPARADVGRRPLPPGHYQLVATMEDLAAGFSSEAVLATQPVDITVTA